MLSRCEKPNSADVQLQWNYSAWRLSDHEPVVCIAGRHVRESVCQRLHHVGGSRQLLDQSLVRRKGGKFQRRPSSIRASIRRGGYTIVLPVLWFADDTVEFPNKSCRSKLEGSGQAPWQDLLYPHGLPRNTIGIPTSLTLWLLYASEEPIN